MSLPPLPKNLGGAFDLSSFRTPAVEIKPEHLGFVVNSQNLVDEVLPASHEAVVILICWSPRSMQAQTLLPLLSAIAREHYTPDGEPTWIFGSVNVDTEPAVAKALQVQSVPLAVAIIQEQLVPLFESIPPADQVRKVIDKVLALAVERGVGAVTPSENESEPPLEAEEELAMTALEKGDFVAARAAYKSWLNRQPANAMAKIGLAQVELLIRIDGLDPVAIKAAADEAPTNIELQIKAADIEVAQGEIGKAFSRLISAVKIISVDEKKFAREHLVELFALVPQDDPLLLQARKELASALF